MCILIPRGHSTCWKAIKEADYKNNEIMRFSIIWKKNSISHRLRTHFVSLGWGLTFYNLIWGLLITDISASLWSVPLIQNISLNLVQFFAKKATWFEIQEASFSSSTWEGEKGGRLALGHPIHLSCPFCCWVVFDLCLLPVVNNLHISILLNPQLAHNDVVNTTCRICPCVGFIVPQVRRTHTRLNGP